MPKFLLLKHYRGAPDLPEPVPPMDQWTPEDIDRHLQFLEDCTQMLKESGEFVDGTGLHPDRVWVQYGGTPGAAPVTTDGPYPETSDLIAGWYLVDVESRERALEIAAHVSSGPGPDGKPMYEWIEVREVMFGAFQDAD
ncbi:YciI family protein [Intrasporangium sp.]|uniref:YciI family protein n=1 Tax=Intrasporangium sp. TaxID=1925024 RepID=UPI00293A5CFA|nr:YciI family protein [Intrasporangium sp.]MDV3220983.1 YciI family protein [Intrasporangium sp.]